MKSIYEQVGRTAFVIAQWRAEEAEQPAPLFRDHVANIFLNDDNIQSAANIAKASPSTKLLVRYRTRYFDDLIMEQIQHGIKQIIILGSGLDTRPIRLRSADVTFYEVEQKHVLEYKQEQLQKFGYASASCLIPCDYTTTDVISLLKKEGFDLAMKTFILWEGNVFYLAYEDVKLVLQKKKKKLTEFALTFDYLSQKLINRSTGFRKSQDLLNSFSSLGAPWNTGFDDIRELAEGTGLALIHDFLIAEYINNRYLEFKVDPSLFDDYSICTLSSSKTFPISSVGAACV